MTNVDHLSEHGTPDAEGKPQAETLPPLTMDTLPPALREACVRAGWQDLMPVQQRAMPYVLQGRDIMVQARTGSGKTGAFVLPLLEKLDPEQPHCQALVLVPTRELAHQVSEEARRLFGESGLRVAAVYGGVGYKAQIEAFKQGAHLVVGTPGRILDHLLNRAFTLDKLRILIFDEADRMLSVGFYPDMREMQRYLPQQLFGAFMFSATYPQSVIRLAGEFLNKPEMLSLSGEQMHVAETLHLFCEVPTMGKERMLIRLLEMENPASAIVFCNTKSDVHYVCEVLKQHGIDAEELSSDLTQAKREQVLGRIREGRLRILVATDVAARGIDIHELSHVFLYEPPEDPESYIHRAGRTGRAGASGTVVTLVDFVQKIEFKRLMVRFNIPVQQLPLPEESDVIGVIEQRLTTLLEAKRRGLSHVQAERVARFLPPAAKLAADEEAHILLALLLDELYQQAQQTAPPEPEPQPQRPPKRSGGKSSRSSGRSEARSEARSDVRSEDRPERRSEPKSERKAEAKPEAKYEAEAEPETKSERKSKAKPEAKSKAKPEAKSETKPEAKPERRSGGRGGTKPVSRVFFDVDVLPAEEEEPDTDDASETATAAEGAPKRKRRPRKRRRGKGGPKPENGSPDQGGDPSPVED